MGDLLFDAFEGFLNDEVAFGQKEDEVLGDLGPLNGFSHEVFAHQHFLAIHLGYSAPI